MKWLKEKLGRAFWWVVLVLAALVAFVVSLFIKRSPDWFDEILGRETEKQSRRSSTKKAKVALKQLEEAREKSAKCNADRADKRASAFRDRVQRRRKEADAGNPDQD